LRYLALDGSGPPQPQRTGQRDPPAHDLANSIADDERLRTCQTAAAGALACAEAEPAGAALSRECWEPTGAKLLIDAGSTEF